MIDGGREKIELANRLVAADIIDRPLEKRNESISIDFNRITNATVGRWNESSDAD